MGTARDKFSSAVQNFNACSKAIGALIADFDKELTYAQKGRLTSAWACWSLADRVGRARTRKIIQEVLGDKAQTLLAQIDQFNKENET